MPDTMTPAEARRLAVDGRLPGWWTWSDDGGATWCDLPLWEPAADEPRDGETWRHLGASAID